MNARNDLVSAQDEASLYYHADEIYYGGNVPKAKGPVNSEGQISSRLYAMYQGQLEIDETGRNYSHDDEDVDAAIFKNKNKPKDKPLCLFLGLTYPHPPYQVEEPFFSMIDRSKLAKRIAPEECSGKAAIQQAIRNQQNLQDYPESRWSELRATYLGMVAKVDSQFRRLCDALKNVGNMIIPPFSSSLIMGILPETSAFLKKRKIPLRTVLPTFHYSSSLPKTLLWIQASATVWWN